MHGVDVQQFWQTGKLESGLDAAEIGQHFEQNKFGITIAALPHMWCDKAHWFCDKRDKPWGIFTPFVEAWNKKQQRLFDEHGAALEDESMVACVPQNIQTWWSAELHL